MKQTTVAVLVAACATAAPPALAFDFAPGDYVPLPAGATFFAGYLQVATSDTFRLDGVGKIPKSRLDTVVGIARLVHYAEIAGRPAAIQVIAPFGNISTAEIGGADLPVADGMGDVTLGAVYWPMAAAPDDVHGTTLGLTLYVTLPTGSYDIDKVSLGSGATTFTPQIGLVQGLGPRLFLDAGVDAAFALDHTEDGVEVSRDPSYNLQAYLRFQPNPATNLSIGYSGVWGGEIDVDGAYSGQKTRFDQIRLFANTMLTPTLQIQGMIGSDFDVVGGFKQSPIAQIRFVKIF